VEAELDLKLVAGRSRLFSGSRRFYGVRCRLSYRGRTYGYGNAPVDEIVVIDPPGYYPQSGYSACGHINVYCDRTPKQGMAHHDQECAMILILEGKRLLKIFRASKSEVWLLQQLFIWLCTTATCFLQHSACGNRFLPVNLWDLNPRKQKTGGEKEKYEGPTIDDYMSPKWPGKMG